jgi:NAD(P)H-dependent FMN reductase
MAQIMAFAGSNSSTSINFQLVQYTAAQVKDHKVQLMNMANFPLPMFSVDYEKEHGYTNSLAELRDDIIKADALILSVNEHNGNPSAYFKNLLDWLSRLERNFLGDTQVFLMATSPGRRGALGSFEKIKDLLPRFGAQIAATFILPSFKENFDTEKGITNQELSLEHRQALKAFLDTIE